MRLKQVVSLLLGQTVRTQDLVTNISVCFQWEKICHDLPGHGVVDGKLSPAVHVN